MKRHVFVILAITTALWSLMPQQGWPESAQPDPSKWNNSGFIRVFEQNGGKLLSGVYRTGGFNNGASPFSTFNDMLFPNPNGVRTLEATVTLLDASTSGAGFTIFPRAGIEGFFYWDGTGTGTPSDQTGHVSASIQLALNTTSGQTEARFFVIKCTNFSCTTLINLAGGSLGVVRFFEPHRLFLDYDGTQFTFQLDSNPPAPFLAPDPVRNPPRFGFKTLRTRLLIPASPTAAGRILAIFDNVLVNGAPYENFDARSLPRVTIMPGSGTFISTQVVDIAISVETGGLAIMGARLTFNGIDVSPVLGGATFGTLATGGATARLANFAVQGLPPGQHVIGVEVTFAGGVTARGSALWNVLAASEP